MAPMGTISALSSRELALSEESSSTTAPSRDCRRRSSRSAPVAATGLVPWDGATMGELEVRGPWISSSYYDAPEAADRWTDDGWFKTGDIVTIEPNGYVEIQDRSKDLVKSGGEWISTVALENALMGHPAVLEAAVIAVPGREVVRASAGRRRLPRGPDGRRGRAPRVPRAALREVVAPGPVRGRRRDPEDRRRQVPQDGAARAVRVATRRSRYDRPPRRIVGNVRHHRARGRRRARHDRQPAAERALGGAPGRARGGVDRLDADDGTRAIVLRGAGERAFVAGADIKEFPALREAGGGEGGAARGLHTLGHRMDAARTPFVAAIKGYCLGGGLELALCCDVRICADDAKLGQPEIKLGLIPGGGGTQRLPRLVGIGRANLLNLGGEFVDAATAYALGPRRAGRPARRAVVPPRLAVAAGFAARSPHAVAVIRELARTTRDLSLEEGLRREAEAFRRCLLSEDGREGVAAFVEKREPKFTGAGESESPRRRRRAPRSSCSRTSRRRLRRRARCVVEVKASAINFVEVLDPPRAATRRCRTCHGCPATEIAGTTARGPAGRSGSCATNGGGYAEKAVLDEAVALRPAGGGVVRGGRRFPDGVPHGLDPAHEAGRRSIPARGCSSTRRQEGWVAQPSSSRAISAPRSSPRRARKRSSSSRCHSGRRRR